MFVENSVKLSEKKTSFKKGDFNKLNHNFGSLELINARPRTICRTFNPSKTSVQNNSRYYSHEMLSSAGSSTESSGYTESGSKNSLNSSESVDTKLHQVYGTSNAYKTKREQSEQMQKTTINKTHKSASLPLSQYGSYIKSVIPMERKSSLQETSALKKDKIQTKKPKKDARRAEIVAAVTKRLYTTKKKPEPKAEPEDPPLQQKDERDDEEPEELKLCSRARAKLQELSRKALNVNNNRKLKSISIDVETQTDFNLHVQRVKEKAVETDNITGVQRVVEMSVGTEDFKTPYYINNNKEAAVSTDKDYFTNLITCSCFHGAVISHNGHQVRAVNVGTGKKLTEKDITPVKECCTCHTQNDKRVDSCKIRTACHNSFQKLKPMNQCCFCNCLQCCKEATVSNDHHRTFCLVHFPKGVVPGTDHADPSSCFLKYKDVAVNTEPSKCPCVSQNLKYMSVDTINTDVEESNCRYISQGCKHVDLSSNLSNISCCTHRTKEVSVNTDQHTFACQVLPHDDISTANDSTCHNHKLKFLVSGNVHNELTCMHRVKYIPVNDMTERNFPGENYERSSSHCLLRTFQLNLSDSNTYIIRKSIGTETISDESRKPYSLKNSINNSDGRAVDNWIRNNNIDTNWNHFPSKVNNAENERYAFQDPTKYKQLDECFSDDSLDSCKGTELNIETETETVLREESKSCSYNQALNIASDNLSCYVKSDMKGRLLYYDSNEVGLKYNNNNNINNSNITDTTTTTTTTTALFAAEVTIAAASDDYDDNKKKKKNNNHNNITTVLQPGICFQSNESNENGNGFNLHSSVGIQHPDNSGNIYPIKSLFKSKVVSPDYSMCRCSIRKVEENLKVQQSMGRDSVCTCNAMGTWCERTFIPCDKNAINKELLPVLHVDTSNEMSRDTSYNSQSVGNPSVCLKRDCVGSDSKRSGDLFPWQHLLTDSNTSPNPEPNNRLLYTITECSDRCDSNDIAYNDFDDVFSMMATSSSNQNLIDFHHVPIPDSINPTYATGMSENQLNNNREISGLLADIDSQSRPIDITKETGMLDTTSKNHPSFSNCSNTAKVCSECNKYYPYDQQFENIDIDPRIGTNSIPVISNCVPENRHSVVNINVPVRTVESVVSPFVNNTNRDNVSKESFDLKRSCPISRFASQNDLYSNNFSTQSQINVSLGNSVTFTSDHLILEIPNTITNETRDIHENTLKTCRPQNDIIATNKGGTHCFTDFSGDVNSLRTRDNQEKDDWNEDINNLNTRDKQKNELYCQIYGESNGHTLSKTTSKSLNFNSKYLNNKSNVSPDISPQISPGKVLEEQTMKHIHRTEKCICKYYYVIMDTKLSHNILSTVNHEEWPISHIFCSNITPLLKTLQMQGLNILVIVDQQNVENNSEMGLLNMANDSLCDGLIQVHEEKSLSTGEIYVEPQTCVENISVIDDQLNYAIMSSIVPSCKDARSNYYESEQYANIQFTSSNGMKLGNGYIFLGISNTKCEIEFLNSNVIRTLFSELIGSRSYFVLHGTYRVDTNSTLAADNSIAFVFKDPAYQPMLTEIARKSISQYLPLIETSVSYNQSQNEENAHFIDQSDVTIDDNNSCNMKHENDTNIKSNTVSGFISQEINLKTNIIASPLFNCVNVSHLSCNSHTDVNSNENESNKARCSMEVVVENSDTANYSNVVNGDYSTTVNLHPRKIRYKMAEKHVSWSDIQGFGALCTEMDIPSDLRSSSVHKSGNTTSITPVNYICYMRSHSLDSRGINECNDSPESPDMKHEAAYNCRAMDDWWLEEFPSKENNSKPTTKVQDMTPPLTLSKSVQYNSADSGIKQKKRYMKRKRRCTPIVSPICLMDPDGLAVEGRSTGGAVETWFTLSAFIKKANTLLKRLNEVSRIMDKDKIEQHSESNGKSNIPCDFDHNDNDRVMNSDINQSYLMETNAEVSDINHLPRASNRKKTSIELMTASAELVNYKQKLNVQCEENSHRNLSPVNITEHSDYLNSEIAVLPTQPDPLPPSEMYGTYFNETDIGIPETKYKRHSSVPTVHERQLPARQCVPAERNIGRRLLNSKNDNSKNSIITKALHDARRSLHTDPQCNYDSYFEQPISSVPQDEDESVDRSHVEVNEHNTLYSDSTDLNRISVLEVEKNESVKHALTNNRNTQHNIPSYSMLRREHSHSEVLINSDMQESSTLSKIPEYIETHCTAETSDNYLYFGSECRHKEPEVNMGMECHSFNDNKTIWSKYSTSMRDKPHSLECVRYYPDIHVLRKYLSPHSIKNIRNTHRPLKKIELTLDQDPVRPPYHYNRCSYYHGEGRLNYRKPLFYNGKEFSQFVHPYTRLDLVSECATFRDENNSHLVLCDETHPRVMLHTQAPTCLQCSQQLNKCHSCKHNSRPSTAGPRREPTIGVSERENDTTFASGEPKNLRLDPRSTSCRRLTMPRYLNSTCLSPRAYMRHLLQLRREIVVASGFNNNTTSTLSPQKNARGS